MGIDLVSLERITKRTQILRLLHVLSLHSKMIIQNAFYFLRLLVCIRFLSSTSSLSIRTYKCLLKHCMCVYMCMHLMTCLCLCKYQQLCPIMICVTFLPWDSQ